MKYSILLVCNFTLANLFTMFKIKGQGTCFIHEYSFSLSLKLVLCSETGAMSLYWIIFWLWVNLCVQYCVWVVLYLHCQSTHISWCPFRGVPLLISALNFITGVEFKTRQVEIELRQLTFSLKLGEGKQGEVWNDMLIVFVSHDHVYAHTYRPGRDYGAVTLWPLRSCSSSKVVTPCWITSTRNTLNWGLFLSLFEYKCCIVRRDCLSVCSPMFCFTKNLVI